MQFARKTYNVNATQWFPETNEAGLQIVTIEGELFGVQRSVTWGAEHGDPHLNGQRLVRPSDYLMDYGDVQEIWRKEDFEKQYEPHFTEQQVNLSVTTISLSITVVSFAERYPQSQYHFARPFPDLDDIPAPSFLLNEPVNPIKPFPNLAKRFLN